MAAKAKERERRQAPVHGFEGLLDAKKDSADKADGEEGGGDAEKKKRKKKKTAKKKKKKKGAKANSDTPFPGYTVTTSETATGKTTTYTPPK
eukprot:SAG22_NODE_15547_length_346_cov_0.825911_1_plen_92_part_10